MQTQSPDKPHSASVPDTGESPLHEHSHIKLRVMILFFVWFFIGLTIVEAAVYGLFKLYRHEAAKMSVPITGLTDKDVTRSIPPEPRLQPSVDHDVLPKVDVATMQARDLAEFRRRGWANEKSDQVIVPDAIVKQIEQMSQPTTGKPQ